MERFGQGCLLVLSSPSYEGALGYEATRDAWRRISGSPRPSRTCCSNVSVLPTHPFIAEVPPILGIASNWDLGLSFLPPTSTPSDRGYVHISHHLLIHEL